MMVNKYILSFSIYYIYFYRHVPTRVTLSNNSTSAVKQLSFHKTKQVMPRIIVFVLVFLFAVVFEYAIAAAKVKPKPATKTKPKPTIIDLNPTHAPSLAKIPLDESAYITNVNHVGEQVTLLGTLTIYDVT